MTTEQIIEEREDSIKMKMRFKRFLSGFMAVATLASTIIQPVTVSASELEPEKIPFEQQYAELKDVQDSLDPNEIVKANDIELSYGQEFDVEVDLSGIEGVDESKIKILFHEAKNEAGTDFDTHTPDTYKAVYAVEPVSGHPAYRVSSTALNDTDMKYLLYNIHKLDWDDTLLNALDIPRAMLPRVTDSSEIYGYTDLCGVQVPVAGIAGDQQAALFGQGCFSKGEAKNTYGTGCFLLMNTGDTICRSKNGLLTTIAISLNGKVEYALEGSVFVGGAVIQWVRDGLRMIQESRDSEYYAQKVPDNGGVYIVPAFTGLGAPYWDMYARGAIVGITRGTTQNHIIRAAEESIAYQSYDLVHAMELDVGQPITALKVDGGASRDQFLMQFQADILNKTVLRPAIRETTALGAAYLAGLATGVWKDRGEIRSLWHCNMTFTPNMEAPEREKLLAGWHKAVGRSRDWAEHE